MLWGSPRRGEHVSLGKKYTNHFFVDVDSQTIHEIMQSPNYRGLYIIMITLTVPQVNISEEYDTTVPEILNRRALWLVDC